MWTIFKVFIEFVTILLLFYVLVVFGREARGILAPHPGVETACPALEGEVPTTGPPGKSLTDFLILKIHFILGINPTWSDEFFLCAVSLCLLIFILKSCIIIHKQDWSTVFLSVYVRACL